MGGATACLAIVAPLAAAAMGQNPDELKIEIAGQEKSFAKADEAAQAKAKKEVAELEAQRSKIDEKLRDARKRAGLSAGSTFGNSFVFSDNAGGDWRAEVKKAMEEAHRAMAEAMKSVPNEGGSGNAIPGVMRIFRNSSKPGSPGELSENHLDDKTMKEIHDAMKKAAETMRTAIRYIPSSGNNGDKNIEARVKYQIVTPDGVKSGDLPRGPYTSIVSPKVNVQSKVMTQDTSDEIRKLREEVRQLREEIRKQIGKGGTASTRSNGSNSQRDEDGNNQRIFTTTESVPVLSDIPYIGRLFQNTVSPTAYITGSRRNPMSPSPKDTAGSVKKNQIDKFDSYGDSAPPR